MSKPRSKADARRRSAAPALSPDSKKLYTFVVDANVDEGVSRLLAAVAHKVVDTKTVLGASVSDREIETYANDLGGVVVTHNVKDFRRIGRATAVVRDNDRRLHRAGLIALRCDYTVAAELLARFLPLVEAELAIAYASGRAAHFVFLDDRMQVMR